MRIGEDDTQKAMMRKAMGEQKEAEKNSENVRPTVRKCHNFRCTQPFSWTTGEGKKTADGKKEGKIQRKKRGQ
jgi:hypothetical protein